MEYSITVILYMFRYDPEGIYCTEMQKECLKYAYIIIIIITLLLLAEPFS